MLLAAVTAAAIVGGGVLLQEQPVAAPTLSPLASTTTAGFDMTVTGKSHWGDSLWRQKTWHGLDFDRPATALQKRVEDATVLVIAVDRHWHFRWSGTGSILAGHRVDGEKPIVTVMHVAGDRDIDNRLGLTLVIADHDGRVLGIAKPVQQRTPTLQDGAFDQPVMLEFDRRYPIAQARLDRIQGVDVAPRLVDGAFTGKLQAQIGIDEGASGGGWYNRQGQLVAVSALATIPALSVDARRLDAHNTLMAAVYGERTDNSGAVTKTWTAGPDTVTALGLGTRDMIALLRRTATDASAPAAAGSTQTIAGAVGFGYVGGVAMGWRCDLQHTPAIQQHYVRLDADETRARVVADMGKAAEQGNRMPPIQAAIDTTSGRRDAVYRLPPPSASDQAATQEKIVDTAPVPGQYPDQ